MSLSNDVARNNPVRLGLQHVLRIGCIFKLIPYIWDARGEQLAPISKTGKAIFNIHKMCTYLYVPHAWFRWIQAYLGGEFSLLASLFAISNVTAFAGYLTLDWYPEDVMHFANRLLRNELLTTSTLPYPTDSSSPIDLVAVRDIESRENKSLSRHMMFNILLLYTNPEVHIFIVQQNPCAPNFLSSWVYHCESSFDNSLSLWKKMPFLLFELYTTSKWQYISCFQWSLIYMALATVMTEMTKMKQVTIGRLSRDQMWDKILLPYRKAQMILTIINDSFRCYLIVFPAVSTAVVSALIYGTIRLWRIDPQSNVMFPLCAIRCGFEALTPLAMAGSVNRVSVGVLAKWRNVSYFQQAAVSRKHMKMAHLMERSCRSLRCSSGSLLSFEGSIYLVTIDNIIEQTVNLLVSFPEL